MSKSRAVPQGVRQSGPAGRRGARAAANTQPQQPARPPPLGEAQSELSPETAFLPLGHAARRAQLMAPVLAVASWSLRAVALIALAALPFVLASDLVPASSRPLGWLLLALSASAGICSRQTGSLLPRLASLHFLVAAIVLVLLAGTLGRGASAPGLGALGVLVALAGLVAGAAAASAVALVAAAGMLGLHLAPQLMPFVAPTQPVFAAGDAIPLVLGALMIGVGLFTGLGMRRVLGMHLASAEDREQRMAGLLAVAVDAHWELDEDLHVVAFNAPSDESVNAILGPGLGLAPWELPQFGCEPEVLDELRADLETRSTFRDMPVSWRSRAGHLRHFRISGEPRFDTVGRFVGYWGVARETTAQVQARAALAATETRYQELFSRIPSPLVLHRGGHVVDANPAALAMFGYADLAAFLGADLLELHESGDSRERARRRVEMLDQLPAGEAAAVSDYRIQTFDGRLLQVRAAAVRVEAPDGPATLSIYVDDTERRRAEESVRRSETMLSHLVATSPDVITLTDLSTAQYAMVNTTFETVTGYSAAEVVGRSALELGIWADPRERDRFTAAVRERGSTREMPCSFVAKSGAVVQMLVSGAVFAMDRRNYLVINARDITAQERSRLERDAILENASVGIAVTRSQRFVLTNPRFNEMYGWEEGELVGQSGAVVWADERTYLALGAEIGPLLAAGELVELERAARRRDGSSFMARVLGKAIDPTHPARGGTVWLIEDITEKRQVAEALARARDEAEAANRAKSAFLANTSHELRTPLNGMLGLAQLAREPALDSTRRDQYLEQIVDNARALASLLSDVLDFSKIEAGKLVLESAPFDLGELLSSLKQGYGTLATGRHLTLQLDLATGVGGHVRGDALRVRQILSNFLSNALKFTAAGSVQLRALRLADPGSVDSTGTAADLLGVRVRFEVIDSGPGLDAATQDRLFRPFTQADESTTRRFGGTGLGLSICRELAHLMGGEVGVQSQAGRGSCFWAELPLPMVQVQPPTALPPRDDPLRGLNVLMVEDNAVNMLIGVALLQRWGARVEQAVDGRQAVNAVLAAHARGDPFDLVLMDIQMPVMSGHEATRELRKTEAGRTLPIIALTAAALVSEREQAMAEGMNDFLTKPIDAERLRGSLARWAAQLPSSL